MQALDIWFTFQSTERKKTATHPHLRPHACAPPERKKTAVRTEIETSLALGFWHLPLRRSPSLLFHLQRA
jgi:hypothetical protein